MCVYVYVYVHVYKFIIMWNFIIFPFFFFQDGRGKICAYVYYRKAGLSEQVAKQIDNTILLDKVIKGNKMHNTVSKIDHDTL